jgi:hypothetical protein
MRVSLGAVQGSTALRSLYIRNMGCPVVGMPPAAGPLCPDADPFAHRRPQPRSDRHATLAGM